MKKALFIALLLITCANASGDWVEFFTAWSAINKKNRNALLGINELPDNKPSLPAAPNVKLSDIKGNVPQAIYDLRAFLSDKQAFTTAGALPPRGILLVGPPGTGKTTIVRALAAEVNVPLIATSASKFVELYVGTGPKAIRELFQQAQDEMRAKNASHAIIFIDEIDSIGSRTNHHQSPEDHKTINELLTQMDGFTKDTAITVIAATNCLDLVDEALLRPGRFDEIITFTLPDYAARLEILKLYAYSPHLKRSFEKNVSLEAIATATLGFSGAELESIINKAALLVARAKRVEITQKDLDQACQEALAMHTKRSKNH